MKIELRKIKIAEYLSEETTAFSAELYINGINAGHVKNDGQGGPDDYRAHYSEKEIEFKRNRNLIEQAEKFCAALPPNPYKRNLEFFIGDLLSDHLEEKAKKKMEKKMVDSLLFGVPNSISYRYVKFKIPLAQIPLFQLQLKVNEYKNKFKDGEVFLNTNLESLGVKI